MKRIYRKNDMGKANYGWLNTHYHFSFADYYNPDRMGFGALRVINDDRIAANSGFEMHPHRDMEIISYVHRGAITHKDSAGNEGRTAAGDLQVITAGTGIMHSEFNLETAETHMYQIWITPKEKNLKPSWAQAKFDHSAFNTMQLLVSGDGTAPLNINQDAKIYLAKISEGQSVPHSLTGNAYLVVLDGELSDHQKILYQGDGLELEDEDEIKLVGHTNVELLLIELGV